jgi:hypothetical protein
MQAVILLGAQTVVPVMPAAAPPASEKTVLCAVQEVAVWLNRELGIPANSDRTASLGPLPGQIGEAGDAAPHRVVSKE